MQLEKHNRKINLACFALPIVMALPAFFFDGSASLLGLLVDFILVIVAVAWLRHKNKQAMWSYLLGFIVVIAFYILGAYMNLSSSQSPWLQ